VGLLSAKGVSLAQVERFAARQVLADLEATDLVGVLEDAAGEARAALVAEGAPPREVQVSRRIVSLRLRGQESAIAVDVGTGVSDVRGYARAEFARRFAQLYGYPPARRALEVESVRVVAAWGAGAAVETAAASVAGVARAEGERAVPVYYRGAVADGAVIEGPAIIAEAHATTFVDAGWGCTVDSAGALILRRGAALTRAEPPVAGRELITARLTGIATDMGETLRRTALSTNVKDRLDFSCAVLDPEGELVVNAPHIPVHLGALGLCVRLVKAAVAMGPGDAVVTNHPAFGGSHLPDVTVITPVFHEEELVAFVASRAHHAEIGGSRPGSMPPGARTLAEEGVVIPPIHLVRGGEPRLEDLRRLLDVGPFPTRSIEENLADVQAQLAANQRGVSGVLALQAEFGAALGAAMDELRTHSEGRVRAALERLPAELHAREEMDDGSVIEVRITRESGRTRIDFAGSSGTHAFNLNAPLGVIRSAVMYVLRLLVDEPLPLNEGLLRAVELVVPEGSFLNPRFEDDPARCPAVSGGNVETSQRVVDTLLRALGLCACSQGTMNNVVFGNERFGYYETVCGGAGAGPSWHGEAAVHTHMTNTRITDPEVLEHRYPVRLERFAVRRGSGGAGQFRGGDGVVRELTFLEPVSLSLLTEHRRAGPYGLAGGAAGAPGLQTLVGPDGSRRVLPSAAAAELAAGCRLILETPGGGGYGPITGARG
jgi:5-oxoprolinase (ATP-hydrolysing)